MCYSLGTMASCEAYPHDVFWSRTDLIKLWPSEYTRVTRDSRDHRLDYYIPKKRAEELYATGVIAWSPDSRTYCNRYLTPDGRLLDMEMYV
jgi:hypothetical protein